MKTDPPAEHRDTAMNLVVNEVGVAETVDPLANLLELDPRSIDSERRSVPKEKKFALFFLESPRRSPRRRAENGHGALFR